MKRVLDFTAALFACILLSPLFLVIALIILVTDGAPIIHKHKRIGKDMKKFIAYPVGKGSTYTLDSRATDLLNTVYYENIKFKSVNPLTLVTEGSVTYSADKKVLISCSGYRGEYIMPDTVEYIMPEAFKAVGALTSVQVSSRVKEIPDYAFENNDYLKTVKLPNKLEKIGKRAFADCNILENVNLPDTLKTISKEAFTITSLSSINIPDSVKCIGEGAFKQTKATVIKVGKGVDALENYVFANNENVLSVNLQEGVSFIGEYAFSGCTSLTSVTIPDSISSIGNSAFEGCDNLTDIYYSGTEAQWSRINIDKYVGDFLDYITSKYDDDTSILVVAHGAPVRALHHILLKSNR